MMNRLLNSSLRFLRAVNCRLTCLIRSFVRQAKGILTNSSEGNTVHATTITAFEGLSVNVVVEDHRVTNSATDERVDLTRFLRRLLVVGLAVGLVRLKRLDLRFLLMTL